MTDPDRLRELADMLEEWNHPLGSAELCRQAAGELERLSRPPTWLCVDCWNQWLMREAADGDSENK